MIGYKAMCLLRDWLVAIELPRSLSYPYLTAPLWGRPGRDAPGRGAGGVRFPAEQPVLVPLLAALLRPDHAAALPAAAQEHRLQTLRPLTHRPRRPGQWPSVSRGRGGGM